MAVRLGLVCSSVLHVAFGAPALEGSVGFLQQKSTETALDNLSFPVAINNSITELEADGRLSSDADPDDANRVLVLQNTASKCTDSKKSCIDRAFKGDCKTSSEYMKANCQLSCGVCSNIWCQSGIYCSADSAAHSSATDIRFGKKCHGFCFPKSCSTSWDKCANEPHTGSKAEVCSEAKQVNCYVPLEHTPISDHSASQALDALLLDLKDEPDKMNVIGKHRKEILGYLVRGIGPQDVPKAILPDEPALKISAALSDEQAASSDEVAPLVASAASTGGCIMDIAAVSVDSVFLVASITSVGRFLQKGSLTKNLRNEIQKVQKIALEKMGPSSAAAKRVFELSAEGASAWKKAGATFSLFASTVSMLSIGQIMKQIRLSLQNVSWWRWLWMGVRVGAQLAAWVLTDGLAFIAQAVSIIPHVTDLVLDAVSLASKLRNGCGSSTTERPPAPAPPPAARRRRSTTSSTTTTTTTTASCPKGEEPLPCVDVPAKTVSLAMQQPTVNAAVRCLCCFARPENLGPFPYPARGAPPPPNPNRIFASYDLPAVPAAPDVRTNAALVGMGIYDTNDPNRGAEPYATLRGTCVRKRSKVLQVRWKGRELSFYRLSGELAFQMHARGQSVTVGEIRVFVSRREDAEPRDVFAQFEDHPGEVLPDGQQVTQTNAAKLVVSVRNGNRITDWESCTFKFGEATATVQDVDFLDMGLHAKELKLFQEVTLEARARVCRSRRGHYTLRFRAPTIVAHVQG